MSLQSLFMYSLPVATMGGPAATQTTTVDSKMKLGTVPAKAQLETD